MKKPVLASAVLLNLATFAVSDCHAQSSDMQYAQINSVIGLGPTAHPWSSVPSDTTPVALYGLIDVDLVHQFGVATGNGSQVGGSTALSAGYLQANRWGIKGSESLGDGFTAFFDIESGFFTNTGQSDQGGLMFGREAIVGLNSPAGAIQFGRRKDYLNDESVAYSNVADFGFLINNAHANDLDRSGGIWTNNAIRYDSPAIGGVSVNLMVSPGGNAGDTDEGTSFDLGVRYAQPDSPFSIGAAYFQSYSVAPGVVSTSDYGYGPGKFPNQACDSGPVGVPCNKVAMIGAKYLINPSWLVHAMWSRVEQPLAVSEGTLEANFGKTFSSSDAFTSGGTNTKSADIIDCGVDYFIGRWKLAAGLIRSRNNFVDAPNPGELTEALVGVDYRFSKRTDTYLNYGHTTAWGMYNPGVGAGGSPGLDRNAQAVTLGLRHLF